MILAVEVFGLALVAAVARQNAGIEAAKARGACKGRQPGARMRCSRLQQHQTALQRKDLDMDDRLWHLAHLPMGGRIFKLVYLDEQIEWLSNDFC